METNADQGQRFIDIARELAPLFAERAARHDAEGSFVADNSAALKEHKLFSAGVPQELGGGGASHAQLCQIVRELAHACGSTALTLSMHCHLLAATVFRYKRGMPGEPLLRKVAAGELVLVSTGAGDWVQSVGRMERAPGGYTVHAVKRFCSGVPAGDLLITTAPYEDPEQGAQVLHFPVSLRAPGVRVRDDWDTHGMRGTGSHTVELEGVFVPEESVSVRRERGKWHPAWDVTMGVAPALYTAPYVGLAERAAQLAREFSARKADDLTTLQSLGELENQLAIAQMALREMVEMVDGYAFTPSVEQSSRMLMRKTIAAKAAIATVQQAVALIGGAAYFRRQGVERLLRDVQGAQFHALPEKKQFEFTGRVTLGLPPV